MSVLEAQNLSKTYKIEDQSIAVLDDVSFTIEAGEFVVIKGSSGSGKSTLLSLLSGLDSPTVGRVFVEEEDITDLSEDELAPLRNKTIGFVFQSFHLVPSLNALENIMFPAELKGDRLAATHAQTLLDRVALRGRAGNYPHQLSGGEKQRVAICRALINDPKILFADEPTGNLDSQNGDAILRLLLDLHRERHMTLIMVTHSDEIAGMAKRILTLHDGRLIADERQTLCSTSASSVAS